MSSYMQKTKTIIQLFPEILTIFFFRVLSEYHGVRANIQLK